MAGKDGKPGEMAVEPESNRFLRPVTTEERERQVRGVEAARATFSRPRDRPGSTYFCADGLTPEETSGRIVQEMMRVAAIVGMEALAGVSLSRDDLELLHRGIFQPVFGEGALGFRTIGHPGVTYPVWEADAKGKSRIRTQAGSAPKQIARALARAVSRLDGDVADLERQAWRSQGIPLHQAVLPAVSRSSKALTPGEDAVCW